MEGADNNCEETRESEAEDEDAKLVREGGGVIMVSGNEACIRIHIKFDKSEQSD